jgi:hypothetical protein
MKRSLSFSVVLVTLSLAFASGSGRAQSPAPIVVQAATATPAAPAAPKSVAKDADANEAAIKMLLQIKAANEEILKKQQDALQRLDEIQKEAEQLKVFSKRG